MRTCAYTGEQVPATLGEYRDLCVALSPHGERAAAVKLLDDKIASSADGREALVLAPDPQLRAVLMPLLLTEDLPHEAD